VSVTRAQIAAALSTVPGITGHAIDPPVKAAGDGWPVWRNSDVLNGCDAMTHRWYVYVVLPAADPGTPPDAADPLVVPIAQALHATTLTVELVEPYQLTFGTDFPIPVLRYTVFD
jgi:hypothetical protein